MAMEITKGHVCQLNHSLMWEGTTEPPAGTDTWLTKSWHQSQGELLAPPR